MPQKIMKHKDFAFRYLFLIPVLLLLFNDASSQGLNSNSNVFIRAILPADSTEAIIYHTLNPPPGHGVLLYRSIAGGEFELVSPEPIMLSFDEFTIIQRAGDDYDALLSAVRRTDALSAIIALRQNQPLANLQTFLSPNIADVLARRLVDPEPPLNRQVTYRVEVVDDFSEPIGMEVTGTFILNPYKPEAPSALRIKNLGHNLRIEWTYPVYNPQRDDMVISFQPHCISEIGDQQQEHQPSPTLRTLQTTLFISSIPTPENGTSVKCRVAARTFAGSMGEFSEEALIRIESVDPLPLATDVTVTQTGGFTVNVEWAISIDDRVSSYKLFRSEYAMEGYELIATLPHDTRHYEDTVPRDKTPWFYAIMAVAKDGREGEMSQPGFALVRDLTPPSTPENFTATPQQDGTVLLEWRDPNPADDLWTYILLRVRDNPRAGPSWSQINFDTEVTETSFTDPGEARQGLAEGDFYRYAIVAVDHSRNRSDTVFTRIQIPDLTPPQSPSHIYVNQNDGYRVSVNWSVSPDGDVVGYRLYRGDDDNPPTSKEPHALLPRNVLNFLDEEVVPGMTYQYRVTAVDSAGNQSEPSPVAEIMVRPANPPANVRNLRVEWTGSREAGGNGQRNGDGDANGNGTAPGVTPAAELFWEPVRSPHLAGYRIYRSDISTGIYEQVGQTGKDQTRWTDPDGAAQRWWYKVYAVDVAGVQSRMAEPARRP